MSISSVSSPVNNELKMAYNPIRITAIGNPGNVVCYIDVYFNGIYYKTIVSNSPDYIIGGAPFYTFDLSQAAQEYLRAIPPQFGLNLTFSHTANAGRATMTVKARGAVNSGGFIIPDGPLPIQATMDNAASPGGGVTPSGAAAWIVLNGAQQLEDLPIPATYLAANNLGFLFAGWSIYNLFNNPTLEANPEDIMHLPVYFPPAAFPGAAPTQNFYLVIETDSAQYYPATAGPAYATLGSYGVNQIYYLPAGPKNFTGLISYYGGAINWNNIKRYRIGLTTAAPAIGFIPNPDWVKWKSPWITVTRGCADRKRFRFVNWLGHFESVVLREHEEEFRVAAKQWEKYNIGDFISLGKEDYGKQRYNVRSGELITATGYFRESHMRFVKEFLSSPRVYIETRGTAGQTDFMTAVRLLDVTALTRKISERYLYAITVKAEMANERINIRN